ncbi:MAG: hypothetical protein ACJATV_000266 [Granulosicoccus sp.]|jgi:hypothetical protein
MQLSYVGTIGITWHFTFSQQVSTINKIVAVIMMMCREKQMGDTEVTGYASMALEVAFFTLYVTAKYDSYMRRTLISPSMKYR